MKGTRGRLAAAGAALMLLVGIPASCLAQSGEGVILTVSGRIGRTNTQDGKSYAFTTAELRQLGDVTIRATNRYTRTADFTGPLLRDVLRYVRASPGATAIEVVTLDGYQQTLPISDVRRWDVVLAHTQGGKRLTVATKGPLWIMYPLDQNRAELDNNETTAKLVWSLTGITIK